MTDTDINKLAKTAAKRAAKFDLLPIIPQGDLTIEFIEKVFDYSPLYVLDFLKGDIVKALTNESMLEKNENRITSTARKIYSEYETYHKNRILKGLIANFRALLADLEFKHYSYMTLRPTETLVFYYAFSIFAISCDLNDISGLKFARVALKTFELLSIERGDNSRDAAYKSGNITDLPEFKRDKCVYEKMRIMIDSKII